MNTSLIQQIRDTYRRYRKVAAYVVILVSALCFVAFYVVPQQNWNLPTENLPIVQELKEEPTTETRYLLASSTPTRLIIPKLDIDVPFEEPLTLNEDSTVGVPKLYTTVGWYAGSPTPGALGPSVILGHVDSRQGAAVFYHLGGLAPGDTFSVERADGSKPTFVVESMERYPQSEFPTEKVYGPIDHAGIRLITCSGTYDKGTLRYTHNLVVYGRLVDPSTPVTE